jgi:hypothetical protein
LEYLERYLKVAPEDKKIYSQMPDFEWLWQDADFQALVGE